MTNYDPKDEPYIHRKKVDGLITIVNDKNSSGGAYQINKETWHDAQTHLGVKNFTPADQDRIARWLIAGRNATLDIRNGQLDNAFQKLRTRWSSLPGSSQAHHSTIEVNNKFQEFLEKEEKIKR